jgi:hypothetical protein
MIDLLIMLQTMNSDERDLPSPDALEDEVHLMPPKVPLRHYYGALKAMRDKGYSYAEVAQWISQKLGLEISRNKVAYLLNTPAHVLEAEDEEEALDEMDDQAAQ